MRAKILFFLTVVTGVLVWGQTGQPVRQTDDPAPVAVQKVPVLSGNNTVALCYAQAVVTTGTRAATRVSISSVSKASPAVVTSTTHGFDTHSRPSVTISGATGTGWSAINATHVATVINANTFSIPVDSSGFGTLGGTVVFTTTAPRTVMPEWAVQLFSYDGSNNVVWIGWLNGTTGYVSKCSEATSTTVNAQ